MKNSIITDLSVKEMQEVNGGGRNTARGLQRSFNLSAQFLTLSAVFLKLVNLLLETLSWVYYL